MKKKKIFKNEGEIFEGEKITRDLIRRSLLIGTPQSSPKSSETK